MFSVYLKSFADFPILRQRVLHVLQSIPTEVQHDFLNDPRFSIAVDNFVPGKGSTVHMGELGLKGDPSRSVVLKPLLNDCSDEFAHYVIAHEFAHAFLRNGPWNDFTDVEDAANALGAHWGFPRTAKTPWNRG